jgi:hypothetical protein
MRISNTFKSNIVSFYSLLIIPVHSVHKKSLFCLFLFFVFNAQSQGISDFLGTDWNKISFKVETKPSFDLVKYKTLIIAEISEGTDSITNKSENIYDRISSQIKTIPNIQLLDRKKTKQILKEFKLQRSGQVEEDFVTPFGKFYSTGIIMTGRILNTSYTSQLIQTPEIIKNTSTTYRKGTQTISFSFQFIDIKTSEIVYSKTLDVTKEFETPHSLDDTPVKLDKTQIFIKTANELALRFKNLMVQYDQVHSVKLQKNSKFNKELKQAAAFIEISEFETAREMLMEILNISKVKKNNKAMSKAFYNIAILDYYTGKLDTAKSFAKKGFLKDSGNDACLELFKKLNK